MSSSPPGTQHGHRCAVYPSSLPDAEWALLAPLLPAPGNTAGRGGRSEKHCRRLLCDAMLNLVRGGFAWAQLPAEFPPSSTVYDVFLRWVVSGGWQRVHDALRDPTPGARRAEPAPIGGSDGLADRASH